MRGLKNNYVNRSVAERQSEKGETGQTLMGNESWERSKLIDLQHKLYLPVVKGCQKYTTYH